MKIRIPFLLKTGSALTGSDLLPVNFKKQHCRAVRWRYPMQSTSGYFLPNTGSLGTPSHFSAIEA